MAKTDFKSVTEYIAAQPKAAQKSLKVVRQTIRKALPGCEEGISYQIPVFKVDGRMVIYFAGFKEHYSIYPSSKELELAFKDELVGHYTSGKGTIRFSASEPVPTKLIAAIAKFRAKEALAKARKKR